MAESEIVLIGLGSNSRHANLAPTQLVTNAMRRLDGGPFRLRAASTLYLTPFVPAGGGADVVNAVAWLESALDPIAVLTELHAIEAEFGRVRSGSSGARSLDLDLLSHGNAVLPDRAEHARHRLHESHGSRGLARDGLIVPHPRLQDRAFVLIPLAEIAPDWHHPATGTSVSDMLAALPEAERNSVRRL